MLIPHRDTGPPDRWMRFVFGRRWPSHSFYLARCADLQRSLCAEPPARFSKQTPSESEEETTTGMCLDTGSLSLKHPDQMIRKLLFLQNESKNVEPKNTNSH